MRLGSVGSMSSSRDRMRAVDAGDKGHSPAHSPRALRTNIPPKNLPFRGKRRGRSERVIRLGLFPLPLTQLNSTHPDPARRTRSSPVDPPRPPPFPPPNAMPPTTSSRLTSTAALILERTRVVSLGLTPSPSTDTKIVRALRQVRDELAARRGGEECEEEWERWETLVGMMREDQVGRQQVKELERPVEVVPCVWFRLPGVRG